jgi:hypothetical protein
MTKSVTILVAMLVAAAGGWFWGASGRWAAERSLRALELRQDLVDGRSALLETRLDIYSVNFGEASKHLENARTALRRAHDQLQTLDRVEDAAQLQTALVGVDDAQRMAGNLDQNANTRSAEVAKIVADVLEAGATKPVVK